MVVRGEGTDVASGLTWKTGTPGSTWSGFPASVYAAKACSTCFLSGMSLKATFSSSFGLACMWSLKTLSMKRVPAATQE